MREKYSNNIDFIFWNGIFIKIKEEKIITPEELNKIRELIKVRDRDSFSIVHYAIRDKNNEVFDYFMKFFGAEVNDLMDDLMDVLMGTATSDKNNKVTSDASLTDLQNAVIQGNIEMVELLLEHYPKIFDVEGTNVKKVLDLALIHKKNEIHSIISSFVEEQHNKFLDGLFDQVNAGKFIPPENIVIVKEFIRVRDNYVLDKLFYAIKNNQLAVVRLFLDEERIKSFIGKKYSDNFSSILHIALNNNPYNPELVRFLFSISPINLLQQEDKNKCTVLHLAAFHHDIDIIKLLIVKLPDLITKQDIKNETFLYYLIRNEQIDLVKTFQKIFSIEEIKNHQTLFYTKNNTGNTFLQFVLDSLVDHKIKFEVLEFLFSIKEIRSNTELICSQNNGDHMLAMHNHTSLVHTILHQAVIKGNFAAVKIILENSSAELLAVKDNTGKTALDHAIMADSLDMVKLFAKEIKTDLVDMQDNDSIRLLDRAFTTNRKEALKFLFNDERLNPLSNAKSESIKKGERIGIFNLKDYLGYTILHHAIMATNLQMVELLLEHASRFVLDQTDEQGRTILHLAAEVSDKNPKIAELLLDNVTRELIAMQDKQGKSFTDIVKSLDIDPIVQVSLIDRANILLQQQEASHAGRLAAERNDGQSSGHNR
jgi:ankyrin repeat protein